MIYLDNAATTLHKPPAVAAAVAAALGSLGNSGRGVHDGSLSSARTVYEARARLARLLGCPGADRVVFTTNSTEALNLTLCGLFGPGDHLISTDLEHNSVLRPLYRLEDAGVRLSFVPADRAGAIRYEDFEALVAADTRAIVCTHASNLTGDPVDLRRVGDIARAHGLRFIVDASQTAGLLPLDMAALGIDVLCFTGHKSLYGPQGTGGLCVGEGVCLRPLKVGGSGTHTFDRGQPQRLPESLEAGTLNAHGIAGLSAGVEYILERGVADLYRPARESADLFYGLVAPLPGITLYGNYSAPDRAPIVTLNLGDLDSAEVSRRLWDEHSIATRPGGHCAPRLHEALGTRERGAVRFSFSSFTTLEEAQTAALAVKELTDEL